MGIVIRAMLEKMPLSDVGIHPIDNQVLEYLIQQELVEFTGVEYKLTDAGKAALEVKDDVVEVFDYFNSIKAQHNMGRPIRFNRGFKQRIEKITKEGFTVPDFKLVIDYLFSQWATDDKFKLYLTPESMFKLKGDQSFSAKLNQAEIWKLKTSTDSRPMMYELNN